MSSRRKTGILAVKRGSGWCKLQEDILWKATPQTGCSKEAGFLPMRVEPRKVAFRPLRDERLFLLN
ncbi:MAG: hypothetical protein DBY39_06270 [Clostridiales bacterium]|nr:MAG: hypothetical protein DBY39_06990 [Clostridiales bacterium]PWL46295.1 MAG: hypothetical protein DBY39_06270 [Clostridiales bacterium]